MGSTQTTPQQTSAAAGNEDTPRGNNDEGSHNPNPSSQSRREWTDEDVEFADFLLYRAETIPPLPGYSSLREQMESPNPAHRYFGRMGFMRNLGRHTQTIYYSADANNGEPHGPRPTATGLSQVEIERLLPIDTYSCDESTKEQIQCCVCLGDMKDGDKIRWIRCKHILHQECLEKWLETAHTCPICRMDVRENKESS